MCPQEEPSCHVSICAMMPVVGCVYWVHGTESPWDAGDGSVIRFMKPKGCQKFPTFKQPEFPSPCSQEPATKPCPDLDNSTPHPPLCLLRLIFVLSSPICLGLWSDVSLSGILTKYSLISPTHATWHAHLFLQAEDYIVFNFVLLFYRRNV